MATSENSKGVAIEPGEVTTIRRALLVGLAAYGEVERLHNVQAIRETCKQEVPEDLRVIHPTGAADTVSDFAEALRALEYAAPATGVRGNG